MENKVIFRQYKKQDDKYLKDIIRQTWQYDKFCTPKIANKLSKLYLYSCLSNQTYTQVALINDIPIGIIMGKDIKKYKSKFYYKIKQLFYTISILLSSEGKKVLSIFSNVEYIDKELLNECNNNYEGELSFFAINSKYRGLGIGKTLFNNLLNYMKNQNINNFYLFTDTSCNYKFYEIQGMNRKSSKSITLMQNSPMTFYLYDYILK